MVGVYCGRILWYAMYSILKRDLQNDMDSNGTGSGFKRFVIKLCRVRMTGLSVCARLRYSDIATYDAVQML